MSKERKQTYVSPQVEIVEAMCQDLICQSVFNEDFRDNPNPVDWFDN